MKTEVFNNLNSLFLSAAQEVFRAIRLKPNFVLGLAAGKTPVLLYKKLVEMSLAQKFSFSQVTTFNLDEYVGITKDHPESFYKFTQEHLFKFLDFKRTEGLNGAATNFKNECIRYEELVQHSGGLDLQILGIGTNGHIGFNEPGSEKSSRTRLVNLSPETQAKIPHPNFEKTPTQGLTLGISNILESKNIIIIATGATKAEAVKNSFSAIESKNYPASFLQSHPHCTLYLDQDSARLLKV